MNMKPSQFIITLAFTALTTAASFTLHQKSFTNLLAQNYQQQQRSTSKSDNTSFRLPFHNYHYHRRHIVDTQLSLSTPNEEWNGEVTPGGTMRGCTITTSPDSPTTFTIAIDGVEADLASFSNAIYRKITSDAKQQRFQGFRPGTIPPHILPTYKAFAMNECAMEATMEAMEQNGIKPFSSAREEITLEKIEIPPPVEKKKKKKKNKKKKKQTKKGGEVEKADEVTATTEKDEEELPPVVVPPAWLQFDTMDEALKGGWEPGMSFSFVATNVRGQRVQNNNPVEGAKRLGDGGTIMDINQVVAESAAADAAAKKR